MHGRYRIHLASLHKTMVACLLLVPFCAASDPWNYEESHDEVRDFVAGGMLHVRLGVGDLHIKRSASNQIRLPYTVKSRRESRVKEAHVDIEIRGRYAHIEFQVTS